MSMLDSFFNKGFKAAKCKTLLKLTIPRIKLLRNRREIQIKQMRRDIAKLLETGQEATARIRVEHVIREENMMAAQEILELFCELIAVRLPIIEAQRECPLDLKEAISSVCFAAPRCADLPELLQVQMLFISKYGKEFVSAATELRPDSGVNRQLIELLSIRAPSPETKLKLLKEIAEEHELDWDPTSTEAELLKQHDDLLNGPTQFVSGSMLPLPAEKHDEILNSAVEHAKDEQLDSNTDIDPLDFPEVPEVPLRLSTNAASAATIRPPSSTAPDPEINRGSSIRSGDSGYMLQMSPLEPDMLMQENSVAKENEMPNDPAGAKENKQFLPFSSPPSVSSASITVVSGSMLPLPAEKHDEILNSAVENAKDEQLDSNTDIDPLDFPEVPKVPLRPSTNAASAATIRPPSSTAPDPEINHGSSRRSGDSGYMLQMSPLEPDMLMQENSVAKENEMPNDPAGAKENKQFLPFSSPPSVSSASITARPSDPPPAISRTKSEANVDLQDVLAAAQAAAESAERAAAAARSAASLAQVRIAELTRKKTDQVTESSSSESPFHTDTPCQPASTEKPNFDHQSSFSDRSDVLYSPDSHLVHQDQQHQGFDSPVSNDHALEQDHLQHQPQRLPSMDDEFFSYPNLFSRQNSNIGSGESFKDDSYAH